MSRRLPFWKSYEVPEQCKGCPYLTSLEKTIEDHSRIAVDGITALGLAGLSSELRGRKRHAQACVGPIALAKSNLVYCATDERALTPSGETANDKLDGATVRQFKDIKDLSDLFPDQEPPREEQ